MCVGVRIIIDALLAIECREKPITFIKVSVGHGLPYNMALIKIVNIQHIHIALAIR